MIQQGLSYRHIEMNIHEITFYDVKFPTIDTFFEQLDHIMGTSSKDDLIRMLIYTSQIPSVQYMISRDRVLSAKYPQRLRSRIAVVHTQISQLSLLNIVSRAMLHSSSMRMFPKDQVPDAVAWLKQP